MSFYGPSWVSVFSLESLNAGSQVKKHLYSKNVWKQTYELPSYYIP